jgi:MtN3 and saliva related transmembrane protein
VAPADRRKKKNSINHHTGTKLINMQLAQIIGLLAGTITSITFLPQVIRIWKTRSAKDLSMLMLTLLIIGTSLWFSYDVF